MNDAMDVALCLALLALRAAIGLAGYSGEGKPPMYGDFEAQRHWMELTVNLPPSHWYVHGSDNDLLYWGLDYPPLSAHASWLVGMFAQRLHPDLVALHASRGIETAATRAFMRNSVLVLDALIYLPAVYACAAYAAPPTGAHRGRRLLLVLQLAATPALVLTDHGHFQYNCVSLGLGLWGMLAAMGGRPHASAIAFSLALNFKQMSLYLAPAFFCYLLAGCLRTRRTMLGKALATFQLAFTVLATFALCWLPFLGSAEAALAVVRRIFPVERHLYEDKVANLWCTLALLPFLKLKAIFPLGTLLRLALGTTLLGLLPPCGLLLARPSRLGFLLCATACALSFFLCSFQVRMHCPRDLRCMHRPRDLRCMHCPRDLRCMHCLNTAIESGHDCLDLPVWQVHEKHILLPLLPAALLAPRQPTLFAWFATTAAFSLYPLLERDGQSLPYAVCQLGFLALTLALEPAAPPTSPADPEGKAATAAATADMPPPPLRLPWPVRAAMGLSLTGMVLLHVLKALVTPPTRYPDIHTVAFAAYSCVHFVAAYVAALGWQWHAIGVEEAHTPFDGRANTPFLLGGAAVHAKSE